MLITRYSNIDHRVPHSLCVHSDEGPRLPKIHAKKTIRTQDVKESTHGGDRVQKF